MLALTSDKVRRSANVIDLTVFRIDNPIDDVFHSSTIERLGKQSVNSAMDEREKELWKLSQEFDGLGEQINKCIEKRLEIGQQFQKYVEGLEGDTARDMDEHNLIQTAYMIVSWVEHLET
jgi:hypothetical protein